MRIYVDVRTIPEINAAFHARTNKKDSFNRWLKGKTITFLNHNWVEINNGD